MNTYLRIKIYMFYDKVFATNINGLSSTKFENYFYS